MPASLSEATVAVLGGDRRQAAVARALAEKAAAVKVYAVPGAEGAHCNTAPSLGAALRDAAAVVLPINRLGKDGRVNTQPGLPPVQVDEAFWTLLAPGALLLAGSVPREIQERAVREGHRLIEYAEIDEIAVLNSIPTAEGALQLAMENMPITVHGSCCFVLGLGRVGMTTARLFAAVGAAVWVVADRGALRARAVEMGCRAIRFNDLVREISRADLVINTVPALVVTRQVLHAAKPSVYLIDLASAPGGVDYEAAAALGRRAELAPGLPGKVAPETAGRILAANIPAIIEEALSAQER